MSNTELEEKLKEDYKDIEREKNHYESMLKSICSDIEAMNMTNVLISNEQTRAWWMKNRDMPSLEREKAIEKASVIKGILDKLTEKEKVAIGLVWNVD